MVINQRKSPHNCNYEGQEKETRHSKNKACENFLQEKICYNCNYFKANRIRTKLKTFCIFTGEKTSFESVVCNFFSLITNNSEVAI